MATVVLLVLGLAGLPVGAELVVRSSGSLALRLGVPPLVIGLTVVSIGTSLPELAIGIDAARTDNAGLAVGNILGTNLVNLLLILGLSAALVPVLLDRLMLRRDLPAMVASAALLVVLAWSGSLGRWDGALLLGAGLVYTAVVIATSRAAATPEAGS